MAEDNNLLGTLGKFISSIDLGFIQISFITIVSYKAIECLYEKWQERKLIHGNMSVDAQIKLIQEMDNDNSTLYYCGFIIDDKTVNDPQTVLLYRELAKIVENLSYTFEDHELSSAFYRNYKTPMRVGKYLSFTFKRKNDADGGYNYILSCDGDDLEKYKNLSEIIKSICIGILKGKKLGKRIAMIEDDDEQEFVN